jgi:hypothetical protein
MVYIVEKYGVYGTKGQYFSPRRPGNVIETTGDESNLACGIAMEALIRQEVCREIFCR